MKHLNDLLPDIPFIYLPDKILINMNDNYITELPGFLINRNFIQKLIITNKPKDFKYVARQSDFQYFENAEIYSGSNDYQGILDKNIWLPRCALQFTEIKLRVIDISKPLNIYNVHLETNSPIREQLMNEPYILLENGLCIHNRVLI